MVFQSYALYPHKTVAENIGFPLKVRKVPQAEAGGRRSAMPPPRFRSTSFWTAIRASSRAVSVSAWRSRAPWYAGPSVFLMDEPLSNLDAKLRGHMRAELKHMQATLGTTTIYVTHDQIEAMTLAHRVAILEKGVLQQLDTPAKIYNDPANLFVAQFIGSPPMNVVHGSLEGSDFKTGGSTVKVRRGGADRQGASWACGPEDCSVVAPSKGNIKGTIYTTELIGDHTLVTVETERDKLTVKASKDFNGKQGDAIGVLMPKDHLFVFDAETGQRIR